MSGKFEWRSEEDAPWEDVDFQEETGPAAQARSWLMPLLILLGLAAAAVILYVQVERRVAESASNVEADVLSAHKLLLQADAQGDAELLATLLSGRDPNWVAAYTDLAQQESLYGRAALGLHLLPVPDPANLAEITLNPGLTSAEVQLEQAYAIQVGNGVTETVTLIHTAVYRRGSERWLLSPTLPEFWGERASASGTILTVDYPLRDEAVVQRLALDLDAKLGEACRTLRDLHCPADLRVHLRLATAADSLVEMADPMTALRGGLSLELPTPTLVGVPVDDAAYQALFRGYAARLVTAVISELVDWTCCAHALFYQALLDAQMSQLGLRPWPVGKAEYVRALNEGIDLEDTVSAWSANAIAGADDPELVRAQLVVDFLLQRFPENSAASLQRQLSSLQRYLGWLHQFAGEVTSGQELSFAVLEREWRLYLFSQSLVTEKPPPIPRLEQALYLACQGDDQSGGSRLWQYHWEEGTWDEMTAVPEFTFMIPFPDDGALLLQNVSNGEEGYQTRIWQDGRITLEMNHQMPAVSLGQMDPAGKQLLIYKVEEVTGFAVPFLIPLDQCDGETCPMTRLAATPFWSPDGEHTLMSQFDISNSNLVAAAGRVLLFPNEPVLPPAPIHLGDGQGMLAREESGLMSVGKGYVPFWLDNEWVGYVTQRPESKGAAGQAVEVVSLRGDVPRTLLTSDNLRQALPSPERPRRVHILYVGSSPANPGLLFLLTLDPDTGGMPLFSFDRDTGEITARALTVQGGMLSLSFSPDGRWLLITSVDAESGEPVVYLHDIFRNETEQFPGRTLSSAPLMTYDWSADGRWLAILTDSEAVILVAPAYGYKTVRFHGRQACHSVAWLNQ